MIPDPRTESDVQKLLNFAMEPNTQHSHERCTERDKDFVASAVLRVLTPVGPPFPDKSPSDTQVVCLRVFLTQKLGLIIIEKMIFWGYA